MITSLFKRSTTHFSGLLLGKIMSTLVFILIARSLQPEKFGEVLLFITIVQLVTILADFGLKQWFQKQATSKDENSLFSKVVSARILSWFLGSLAIIFCLYIFQPFALTISILLILTTIPEAFNSIAEGYYLKMKKSFKVGLRTPSVMLVFFIAWLISGFSSSVPSLIFFWAIGSLTTMIWFFPFKKVKLNFVMITSSFTTLKKSSDYALLTTTALAYARADQLIVKYYRGSFALGLYGAAYRYLDTLSLLPSALTQNLFPVAAKKGRVSGAQLKKITFVSLAVGLVIAGAMFLSADLLTTGLLGAEYAGATILVKIFSVVLVFFFINGPLSSVVQSSQYVRKFLPFGIANTVLNIALNLALVPFYGVVVSALIMIITEFTGMVINLYFVRKVYRS